MARNARNLRSGLIRLLPFRLRYGIRTRRNGGWGRSNIDLVVDRRRRRWLRRTPDTCRIVPSPGPGTGAELVGDRAAARRADEHRGDAAAAIVGAAAPPAWWEPEGDVVIAPAGVAVATGVLEEIGAPPSSDPAIATLERLLSAGHRIVVVPEGSRVDRPRRRDTIDEPSIALFSLVPMHDVGGGSRPAQLAVALLGLGFHVTYVFAFASRGTDHGVRFVHPSLEQRHLARFMADELTTRARRPAAVVAEAPFPAFVGPVRDLGRAGYAFVYDAIDDWSGSGLGWDWHSPRLEDRFAAESTAVTATTPALAARLERVGPKVSVVPNGVDEGIFTGERGDRPPELPDGVIVGFHGTMWGPHGTWIDWDSVASVARSLDGGSIVMIGDPPDSAPSLPGNVVFLPGRPQIAVAEILPWFDAGIVPFVRTEVTHSASPLKAYEYLASGVPVAAPPLRSLAGIEGVHTDDDLVAAVARARRSRRPDRQAVAAAHGWTGRAREILTAAGVPLPDHAGRPCRTVVRPTVHWSPDQRSS